MLIVIVFQFCAIIFAVWLNFATLGGWTDTLKKWECTIRKWKESNSSWSELCHEISDENERLRFLCYENNIDIDLIIPLTLDEEECEICEGVVEAHCLVLNTLLYTDSVSEEVLLDINQCAADEYGVIEISHDDVNSLFQYDNRYYLRTIEGNTIIIKTGEYDAQVVRDSDCFYEEDNVMHSIIMENVEGLKHED